MPSSSTHSVPHRMALIALHTLSACVLIQAAPGAQTTESPWGIRNINRPGFGLEAWDACADFEPSFGQHQPGHINFWINWDEIEPPADACPVGDPTCDPSSEYELGILDNALDKVFSVDASPVVHFKLRHSSLMQQSSGAVGSYTKPTDMGSEDIAANPLVPPPTGRIGVHGTYSGYSERLYGIAYAVAEEIKGYFEGSIAAPACAPTPTADDCYVVFHPEQWDTWGLGATQDWATNLNTYILSFLTVRQAFAEVQATTDAVTFHLSHGSIPRYRVLPMRWYEQGIAGGPEIKSSLVTPFRSLTERIPRAVRACKIGGVSIGSSIDNWDEILCFASPNEDNPDSGKRDRNRKMDTWMGAILDWTCEGLFDFNVYHGHGKALWDDQEREYFDEMVSSRIASGECDLTAPPRWMIAESAFEVLDDFGDWPAQATASERAAFLANRDEFILQDLARKWCTMMAQDGIPVGSGGTIAPGAVLAGFCTPVVAGSNAGSGPYPNYTGLTQLCGGSGQSICGTGSLPVNTTTGQLLDPHPANQAFISLSSAIGAPDSISTVADDATHVQIRFDSVASRGEVIDAVWSRELFDIDANLGTEVVLAPGTYRTAQQKVLDAQGNLVNVGASQTQVTFVTLTGLTQEPVFVFWTP